MSNNLRYIEYADKVSALDLSSVYVVSNYDANEIKEVVNNLVNRLAGEQASFSKVFKYAQINIPTTLNSNSTYDMIVQFSTALNFENTTEISVSQNSGEFYIFNNNVYNTVSSPFSSALFGKDVLISLEGHVDSEVHTYVRYKFVNTSNSNDSTEWRSFALGTNDFQKYPVTPQDEIPIAVTINSKDPLSGIIGRSKNYVSKTVMPATRFTSPSMFASSNFSTYFKYEGQNELKNNVSYAYSYGSSLSVNDGDTVFHSVSGTVAGKTGVYQFAYSKDKFQDSIASLPAINASETSSFIVYQKSKLGTTTFATTASITTGATINANAKTIAAYATDVSKTLYATIDKKVYPMSVIANDVKWLSAYFQFTTSYTFETAGGQKELTLKEIAFDNVGSDLTASSVSETILNKDSHATITFTNSGSSKNVSVSNINAAKTYNVMLTYTKNNKKMFAFINIKANYTPPEAQPKLKYISLNEGLYNSIHYIDISGYFDSGNPSQKDVTQLSNFKENVNYISIDTQISYNNVPYIYYSTKNNLTLYPIVDFIQASYISGNQTCYDYMFKTIEPYPNQFVKILIDIEGSPSALELGHNYTPTISGVLFDGTITNLSNRAHCSVYKPKEDNIIINNNEDILQIANSGQSRFVVLNAELSGVIGQKCFYVKKVESGSVTYRQMEISCDGGGDEYETRRWGNILVAPTKETYTSDEKPIYHQITYTEGYTLTDVWFIFSDSNNRWEMWDYSLTHEFPIYFRDRDSDDFDSEEEEYDGGAQGHYSHTQEGRNLLRAICNAGYVDFNLC